MFKANFLTGTQFIGRMTLHRSRPDMAELWINAYLAIVLGDLGT